MPRFTGRNRRDPRKRPRVPSIRIHTTPDSAAESDQSNDESVAPFGDPLARHRTIQLSALAADDNAGGTESEAARQSAEADPVVGDDPSLGDYIDRIEASAARLRAEHEGVPSTLPQAADPGTAAVSEAHALRRRPPARRQGKASTEPAKPWYRRRRTYFIGALVIPLLFVAVATVYVLNIIRLSVNAYDEIHEEPVERTRYTVNTEGTPVPVPSAEVQEVVPNWSNDEPVNIVLLGVDAQTDEDQPPRSDTSIVVRIEPATGEVTMMSIPRDLLVFIPGFGEDKFNAAYPIGEANEDEIPGGGPTLVAQTIEANFNIPIHYFATIDFDGFRNVVDTVGGVMIDVDTQLSDNQYPTDDLRLTRIYFPTGLQRMDGDRALQYVRTRHADSDFGRAERQQQVLMAIREQAVTLDLITRAQSLIRDMQDTIRTDLDFNQMLALANLGRGVNPDDIARINLFGDGLLFEHLPEFDGDAYYISADWGAVLEEISNHFGGGAPVSDTADAVVDIEPDYSISVFVENGTNIPLLAGSSAQLLVEDGFEEVWPSDARRPQAESTIQVSPAQVDTARHIADLLGLPDSSILTVTGSDGITVILGEDVPASLIPDASDDQVSG